MKNISSFIPKQAYKKINKWLSSFDCKVIITNPRQTKLGDYRSPNNDKNHIISINNNLNKYSFLITLTHEIAHMMIWERYKNNVKPHGNEWKEMFKKLMINFIPVFPNDIQQCLAIHLKNPKSSCSADYTLVKVLRKYNKIPMLTISDIPDGRIFLTPNGKRYIKEKKIRTRFQCKSLDNNRTYLFNPLAEVQI
tara:strand:+ start:261 stop:842 length:582 start_codon:yes stop_codon:yes gene_type:complete